MQRRNAGFIQIIIILIVVVAAIIYFVGVKNGNFKSIINIGSPMPTQTPDPFEEVQNSAITAYIKDKSKTENSTITIDKSTLKIMNNWAFGSVMIQNNNPNPNSDGPNADFQYFLAQKNNNQWTATIAYTQEFKDWLNQIPTGLINPDLIKVLR